MSRNPVDVNPAVQMSKLNPALMNDMDLSVKEIGKIIQNVQQSEDRPIIACDLETQQPVLGPFQNASAAENAINQIQDFLNYVTDRETGVSSKRWVNCTAKEIIDSCRLRRGWDVVDPNPNNRVNAIRDILLSTEHDSKMKTSESSESGSTANGPQAYSKARAFLWTYTDSGYPYERNSPENLDPAGRLKTRPCEVFEISSTSFGANDFIQWIAFHVDSMNDLTPNSATGKNSKIDPINLPRYSGAFFFAVESMNIARKVQSYFPFPARVVPYPTDCTKEAAEFREESLSRMRRYIQEGLAGGSILDAPDCGPVFVYGGFGIPAIASRSMKQARGITKHSAGSVDVSRLQPFEEDTIGHMERKIGSNLLRPIRSVAEGRSPDYVMRCEAPPNTACRRIGAEYLRGVGPKYVSDYVTFDSRIRSLKIPGLYEIAQCCCIRPDFHNRIIDVLSRTGPRDAQGIPYQNARDISGKSSNLTPLTELYEDLVRTRVIESFYNQPTRTTSGDYVYDFATFSRNLRSNDAYARDASKIVNAISPDRTKDKKETRNETLFLTTKAGPLTVLEKKLVRVAWILFLKDAYRQRQKWTQKYVLKEHEQSTPCYLCRAKVLGNPWRCMAAISKALYYACDRDPDLRELCKLEKVISFSETEKDRFAIRVWEHAKSVIRQEYFGSATTSITPRTANETSHYNNLYRRPIRFMANPFGERAPVSSPYQCTLAFRSVERRDSHTYAYNKDRAKVLFQRFHRAYLRAKTHISSQDIQGHHVQDIDPIDPENYDISNFGVGALIRSVGTELFQPNSMNRSTPDEKETVVQQWMKTLRKRGDGGDKETDDKATDDKFDLQSEYFSDTLLKHARASKYDIHHPLYVNPGEPILREAMQWEIELRNTISDLVILNEFIGTLCSAKLETNASLPVDSILLNCTRAFEERAEIMIEALFREQFVGTGITYEAHSYQDGKARIIQRSDSELIRSVKQNALRSHEIWVHPDPSVKSYSKANFKPFQIHINYNEIDMDDEEIDMNDEQKLTLVSIKQKIANRLNVESPSMFTLRKRDSHIFVRMNLVQVVAESRIPSTDKWSEIYVFDRETSVNTLKAKVLRDISKQSIQTKQRYNLDSILHYHQFHLLRGNHSVQKLEHLDVGGKMDTLVIKPV